MSDRLLEFEWKNREYSIPFMYYPATQIMGNSASGKSLLVQDFLNARKRKPDLANSLVITPQHKEGLRTLKERCYEFVIIDNADIIITDEIDAFIYEDITDIDRIIDTKYIIMGRKEYLCTMAPMCTGCLRETISGSRHYFTIDFTCSV